MKSHLQRVPGLLVLMIAALLVNSIAYGQEMSTLQPSNRQVFLSLEEAIAIALQNNLEIQTLQYDPEIKKEAIRKAEAAFRPTIKSSGAQVFNEKPSSSQSPTSVTSLDMTVNKGLSTGGNIQAKLETSRAGLDTSEMPPGTPDTQYETSLSLSVGHALFKGRGTAINRTPILIAQKQREMSVSQLRSKTTDIVSEVKTSYWRLINARGDLEAKRLSLQLAYDLVKINEAQVKVGTLAPIEVLQAQATAASREVSIISAEQKVRDEEDELKRLLSIPDDDPVWQAAIVPTDSPIATKQPVSLDDSIRTALENSEQLRQLQQSIEMQQIALMATRNQLQPDLNIQGGFNLSGTDENWGGSLGETVGFDTYSFSVGASFSYPLGNIAAKSDLNKANLELDKTRLSIRNVEQLLITQVKQMIRAVETSYRLVEASQVALELAQQQLDAEQKKFNEGLSTNFQVLQFQESLANARSQHTQAITGYNQALVGLDQVTGMTLSRHGIVINE
jgi:outer membrane protein TolC